MPSAKRTQAAEYLRMSTDKQCYSIANQGEAIRTYAEREGLEIVAWYGWQGAGLGRSAR